MRVLPLRSVAALALAGGVCLAAPPVRAQDYYPKQQTVGCFSIGVTRRLTDPRDARRSDPAWLKTAMRDGNCRQVPHDEDWKLVTTVEEFSLMRHDVPGSDPSFLFFRSADLADWHGVSPGLQPPPPPKPGLPSDGVPRIDSGPAQRSRPGPTGGGSSMPGR